MIEEAEQIIETALQIGWTDSPVDFDNVQFNPVKGQPYIRMQIEWFDAAGAGPHRIREDGYVLLHIFVPVHMGTRFQAKMIDKLKILFMNLRITGMHFKPSRVQRVGENRGWYQRNLIVPFDYNYCREIQS